jgi:hypothetical protein
MKEATESCSGRCDSNSSVKITFEKTARIEFRKVLRRWLKAAFTTLTKSFSLHPKAVRLFLTQRITPDFTFGGG